ncbi:MAG: cytochrome P450 [bacterium]|nr:cytochrome P450 [bacterium]
MPRYDTAYPIWEVETRANPQGMWEEMRRETPVYYQRGPVSGRGFWFFLGYEDSVAVLKDQRFGKEIDKHLPPHLLENQPKSDSRFDVINRNMLFLDPPDHTRLRALVHKAFTPRIVENLRPRIRQIANDLLEKMRDGDQQEVDFISAFALPIPITVIAEMLGVPLADQEKFREWTRILLFDGDEVTAPQAVMEFMMYMHDLIDQRRENPREDVISGLVFAEEAGDTLTREELLSMIFLLLVAGHETTVNLIGNGTLLLMQNRDQMDKLRTNPGLIDTAIEEMLRYNGPVEIPTMRWAFEDVEIGGVTVPQGDLVMPVLLAANRDPSVFPQPHTFDIARTPNRHIAFGSGIHYCLGAPLARLEGAIAIDALMHAIQDIELAVPLESLQWNDSLLLHGMKAMPVGITW